MKGQADLAVMTAWHTEAFARTKQIKPLGKYLEPKLNPEQRREDGARKVRAMFKRMAKKKGD